MAEWKARKTEIKASRRELTVQELNTICNRARGELQTLFVIGIYTGLRFGDCCTLRWAEVDMARKIVLRVPNKTAIARRDEIDARLVEVEQSLGTCSGHPALARAIATLLRCQRAQLTQRAASTVAAAKAGGVVGALLIGCIEAAKYLAGK